MSEIDFLLIGKIFELMFFYTFVFGILFILLIVSMFIFKLTK